MFSMFWLRSSPTDILAFLPNRVSIRPEPVPRSDDALERAGADRLFQRGLDGAFADIQAAQAVPLGGDLFEIADGGFLTVLADLVQAAVIGLARVLGQDVQHGVDQATSLGVVRQAVVDTGAVGKAFDQAGVGHQLQMARHARLALVQNPRHLHDRQLFPGQQGQDAQAGRLASGAQGFDGLIGGQAHAII